METVLLGVFLPWGTEPCYNCARNLAKSTTKYYVTVYGLENYIMALIRLHFKKEILLSLLKSLQTKCHEITQDYNT